MDKIRCHSPGCFQVVPWKTAYCSRCDSPRTDVERIIAEYVHTDMSELELERRIEAAQKAERAAEELQR